MTPRPDSAPPLDAIAECAAYLRDRVEETEKTRSVPSDVLDRLRAAGCLRMMAPEELGGGSSLREMLMVVRDLSRIDGALGWVVAKHTLGHLIISRFPRELLRDVYENGPDVLVAGAIAPHGRATHRGDSWRVTGRWPFVTGCRHADWIYLQCLETDGRRTRTGPDGGPKLRMILLPSAEVEVMDTWSVMGLRGTGSHDVTVSRLRCPDTRAIDYEASTPAYDDDVYRIPMMAQGGLFPAAVALGIAQGALDDLRAMVEAGRRRTFEPAKLGEKEGFRSLVGEAVVRLEAMDALVFRQAADLARPAARTSLGASLKDVAAATPALVVTSCAEVVRDAFLSAGGESLFNASPLQRRFRDVHAVTQHAWCGRSRLAILGAALISGWGRT